MSDRLVSHLLRSKGLWHIPRRLGALAQRLGPTPARFSGALDALSDVLTAHGVPATFPTTGVALARHPRPLQRLAARGIEIAVHSYLHIDLSLIPPAAQRDQVVRARAAFAAAGLEVVGFRAPYLRANPNLLRVLAANAFSYDSSTCALWPVLAPAQQEITAVRTVLDFYRPDDAAAVPVLPSLQPEGLIEIPVSLPDDEILVDRLGLPAEAIAAVWRAMLDASYAAGELLVLQLHPERGRICAPALDRVLSDARSRRPHVWVTTLAEVATWWKIRPQCQIDVQPAGEGLWAVAVNAPPAARLLTAGRPRIDPMPDAGGETASRAWFPGTDEVLVDRFTLHAALRPLVGLAPDAAQALLGFLRQQGYIVEISADAAAYPVYFDWPAFDLQTDGRRALRQVESTDLPLLRFARWPQAAAAALVVSGDIDSLTLWDYLWRLRAG